MLNLYTLTVKMSHGTAKYMNYLIALIRERIIDPIHNSSGNRTVNVAAFVEIVR